MKIETRPDGTTVLEDRSGSRWKMAVCAWLIYGLVCGWLIFELTGVTNTSWTNFNFAVSLMGLIIVAVVGLLALLFAFRRSHNTTLVIDPRKDRVKLEQRHIHTTKRREFRVWDIARAECWSIEREDLLHWYTDLELKSGERLTLFDHGARKPEGADDPVAAIQAAIASTPRA